MTLDGVLSVVAVTNDDSSMLSLSRPRELTPLISGDPYGLATRYVPSTDGERFFVNPQTRTPLELVIGWQHLIDDEATP